MVDFPPVPAGPRLNTVINFVPGSPLLYINNPKVGCTNVKWSMITTFAPDAVETTGSVHRRDETPFAKGHDLAQSLRSGGMTIFSIVRHPRRRFVSAYFDKLFRPIPLTVNRPIRPGRAAGTKILESVGLDPRRVHRPKTVLKELLKLPALDMNPHVAPQVVNLFWGSIPYAHVFRLECRKKNGDALDFGNFRLPLVDRSGHSTAGKVDLSLFDAEDFEMIDHLYRDDYAAFGYPPDPSARVGEKVEDLPHGPFLLDLLTAQRPVAFLKSHFGLGPVGLIRQTFGAPPPDLTGLETAAMIDLLFDTGKLLSLPPRLLAEVERAAARWPETVERLNRAKGYLLREQGAKVSG